MAIDKRTVLCKGNQLYLTWLISFFQTKNAKQMSYRKSWFSMVVISEHNHNQVPVSAVNHNNN